MAKSVLSSATWCYENCFSEKQNWRNLSLVTTSTRVVLVWKHHQKNNPLLLIVEIGPSRRTCSGAGVFPEVKAHLNVWHKTALEELKSHCALYFKHSIEWLAVSQTFPPFKLFAWLQMEEVPQL